jgi:hypothetical protein
VRTRSTLLWCAARLGRFGILVAGSAALAASPAPADEARSPAAGGIPKPPAIEAWWTGPLLANTPATPPRGGAMGETFLFEQIGRDSGLHGWLTYVAYGVTDRLAVGAKPLVGTTTITGRTSRLALGDVLAVVQYRLTSPAASARAPTVAILLQGNLPTGRYDHLDSRPVAPLGSGAPTITASLYAQQSFRIGNGHLLRARVNLDWAFEARAAVVGASVYGTGPDFRGRVSTGRRASIDLAAEYSLSRAWALAVDVVYERVRPGSIIGVYERAGAVAPVSVHDRIDGTTAFALAPAVEHSLSSNVGLLIGTRFRLRGRNAPPSVTPAVAITFAFKP